MEYGSVIKRFLLALGALAFALFLALLPTRLAHAGQTEGLAPPQLEAIPQGNVLAPGPQAISTRDEGGEGLVKDAAVRAEPFTTANGFKGWKVHVPDGKPLATPAVAEGLVYVGGGFGTYDFYAFDAESGNLRWQYHVADDGPTAAIVHRGRVAFNTESCILYVLDAKTGKKVWSQWLGDPLMAMPAAAVDRIYMSYPGAEGRHYLSCRALETGKEFWNQPLAGEVITAPVVSGESVFCATLEGTVYHFDAVTGKLIWKDEKQATSAPWVAGEEVYVSKRQEELEGGTKVQYEGLAGLGRGSGRQINEKLHAYAKADYLQPETASEYAKKQKELDAAVGFASAPGTAKLTQAESNLGVGTVSGVWAYQGSRPLVAAGVSYAAMGDAVRAVDIKSGKIIWEKRYRPKEEIGGRVLTPPAKAGDKLYFASTDGDVICVRAGDGDEIWRFSVGEPVRFQPAVMDGKVYVGTENGNIFCVDVGDASAHGWAMWGGNAGHNGWEE